ncbi:uncharacterized protein ACIB01_017984 [Guaruba guarouba]
MREGGTGPPELCLLSLRTGLGPGFWGSLCVGSIHLALRRTDCGHGHGHAAERRCVGTHRLGLSGDGGVPLHRPLASTELDPSCTGITGDQALRLKHEREINPGKSLPRLIERHKYQPGLGPVQSPSSPGLDPAAAQIPPLAGGSPPGPPLGLGSGFCMERGDETPGESVGAGICYGNPLAWKERQEMSGRGEPRTGVGAAGDIHRIPPQGQGDGHRDPEATGGRPGSRQETFTPPSCLQVQ